MACMEHECTNLKCDWYEMNNSTVKTCPKCGAKVLSTFDEQFDHYPDEAYQSEEDND